MPRGAALVRGSADAAACFATKRHCRTARLARGSGDTMTVTRRQFVLVQQCVTPVLLSELRALAETGDVLSP